MKDRTIKVKFGHLNSLTTDALYQYDTGQQIEFKDEFTPGTEVQFEHNGTTINTNIFDGKCYIPDEVLTKSGNVIAWIQVIGDDSTTTVKKMIIPVTARPNASDIVAPEHQPTFREEIRKMVDAADNAADRSEAANEDAGRAALNATKAAEEAEKCLGELKEGLENGDFKGEPGKPGKDGLDYVLTLSDKREIAGEAARELGYTLGPLDRLYKSLYVKETNAVGKRISGVGALIDAGGWRLTDYIPVSSENMYAYSGVVSALGMPSYQLYDENKKVIVKSVVLKKEDTINFDDKGKYVRFSFRAEDEVNFSFVEYRVVPNSALAEFASKVSDSVYIKWLSDAEYEILFGKYKMKLFYTDNSAADQHNWNIGKIYHGDQIVVPSGTDIVGPIKIIGDSDFLSGVHGSSTTNVIKIYCDGVPTGMNSSLDAECKKIDIYMVDECRSKKTLEHVFDRYVVITVTKNKIHVCNTFKCVSEASLTVERAANGGLMAVRNDILTSAYMNNYLCTEAPIAPISNNSPKNTHAVLNLTTGAIEINNIVGKENKSYMGNFAVFVNENPVRTKTYFDVMRNEQVVKGQEIVGEFEYTFT